MNNRRIVIAGGGTGGHIFPALAIAGAIGRMAPDTAFLFIGAKGKMEMEKVPEAGYRIVGLDIAGFDRKNLLRNIGLPFQLLRSFLQVRSAFRAFRPDAVIGVGGYSSYPVLRYAQAGGLPTYIHESNAFAGKSNRLLGRKARKIFVAASGMEHFFPADKLAVTGNPVRATIATAAIPKETALLHFGLDPRRKTILSIGGSLGARSINRAVEAGLDRLSTAGLQLIWQTGSPYADQARAALQGRQGMWTAPFIREMEYALAAADLVISRAGAMSVAELAVMRKPAVFVPFPHAAEDHQTANARKMEACGAALIVADGEAQTKLIDTVIDLAAAEERLAGMAESAGSVAIRDADERIAAAILKDLEKQPQS